MFLSIFFILVYMFLFYSICLLFSINTYLFIPLVLCIIQLNAYTAMLHCMEAHSVVMQQLIVLRNK